jgi:hypothetical protein
MLKMFSTKAARFILFGLIACLVLNGCATIFSDGEDVVTFNSNVDQTNVFLDGSKIGVTPLTLSLDRQIENRPLKFTKPGYQTQEMMLGKTFNNNFGMILDLTGTATTLTPMGINALSGNMIRYTPTEYHIEMEPEKSGDHRLFRQRVASMRFAAYNFPDIQKDLVAGEGEYLDGLNTSFQIPLAHKETFKEVLQANLKTLITADNGLEFWNHLNRLVGEHSILKRYRLG